MWNFSWRRHIEQSGRFVIHIWYFFDWNLQSTGDIILLALQYSTCLMRCFCNNSKKIACRFWNTVHLIFDISSEAIHQRNNVSNFNDMMHTDCTVHNLLPCLSQTSSPRPVTSWLLFCTTWATSPWETDEPSAGEQLLEEALRTAPALGPCTVLSTLNSLNQLGLVWSRRGEHNRSQHYLQTAETIYRQYKEQITLKVRQDGICHDGVHLQGNTEINCGTSACKGLRWKTTCGMS